MANRTRARSADGMGQQEMLFGELIHALRDLRVDRPAPREQFRAPQYSGESDVELFITQFTEVATANQWNQMATLLHLRESLQENVKEYGRYATTEAIFAALRGQFELTTKEARSRLSSLKKDSRKTLYDHANDVENLVRNAFEGLPEHVQAGMMLDTFCSSIENAALQRHLLGLQSDTVKAAIQHRNEYLQVKPVRLPSSSTNVRALRDPDSTDEEDEDPLAKLTRSIQLLAKKVELMEKQAQQPTKPKPRQMKCWGCQQVGQTRKECKTHPWTSTKSANGDSS